MSTVELFNTNNSNKLEYVNLVAREFIKQPSETEISKVFQSLYNNHSEDRKTSLYPLSLEDFEADTYKEVRDTLTQCGIDLEKFWYLLLFINDYIRRKLYKEAPLSEKEDVCKFKRFILKHLSEIDITIRIDNQPMYTIKNKKVITYIESKCNLKDFPSNEHNRPSEHKVDRTYMFYKILRFFLKQNLKNSMFKEIHPIKIISALLYLTKLHTNEHLINDYIYKNCKGNKTTVLSGLKSGGKWIEIPAYPYESAV